MQPIEIPVPTSSDSETVVTALEMAAVFAQRGDNAEALRWLKRAVDSASEAGDDERILSLARSAAELNVRVQPPASSTPANSTPSASSHPSAEPLHSRPVPKPPLKSNAGRPSAPPDLPADGAPDRGDATPLPLSRPSLRPSSGLSSPTAPSGRPLPPSARVSSVPSAPRASHPPLRSGSTPVTGRTPEPARVDTQPLGTAEVRQSQVPANPYASPSRSATLRQFPAVRPQPQPQPPPDDSETTAPGGPTLPPPRDDEAPAARATPGPPAVREPAGASSALRGARVSVVESATQRGLYLLRVLESGEAPPDGSAEAYVVFVDPKTTLLR